MNLTPVIKYVLVLVLCSFTYWLNASTSFYLPQLSTSAIIDTTICEGDCVVLDNATFCNEGTFQLSNNQTLRLTLAPRVQQVAVTICEGETFAGQDWSTNGRYNYQTTMGACDITVWVDLRVERPKETFITQELRYGECQDFGPNTLCQTGEYELRYTTIHGCDSTVYIDLIVEELLVDTLPSVTVCSGGSYSPNGLDTLLTSTGLYQFHGMTAEGRPTLTLLDFRVENEIITIMEEMVCEGEVFVYNGQAYDRTGVYEFNYLSANGCDSSVVLDLTVNAVITTVLNETIASDAFIAIGNNVVNLQGSYEFIFQTETGCDSVVQLELSIDGPTEPLVLTEVAVSDEICNGTLRRDLCLIDLPFRLGQNTFYQGGTFDLIYVPPDGCVSEISLELSVALSTESLTEQICEGEIYSLNNTDYTQTGIYSDTLIAAGSNGCDSIIVLDLMVMPIRDTTIIETICWGDPFAIGGQFITESGMYTERYLTDFGCDSMVTTILTVEGGPNPNLAQLTLCAGDSYSDNAGTQVFVSGLYNFRFSNESGCDSIVTLDLLIPDTIREAVDTFFCNGESFEFENFAVTRAGFYRERFFSALGCDSLVEYTLTSLDCEINSLLDADTIICGGNTGEFSFTLIKGQAPFSYQWVSVDSVWRGEGVGLNLQEEVVVEGLPSGEYRITVADRNGQEAVLEVVIFRPEIITAEWILPPLQGNTHLACFEDVDAFLAINPAGGLPPYRYAWSTGMTNTNRIENLSAGIYTVTITDDFNCPFIVNQEITAPPPLAINAIVENATCEDQASGQISIVNTEGGTSPYQYQLASRFSSLNNTNFENLAAGEYQINVTDANGCQIDTSLFIEAPEILSLDFDEEILINLGEGYDLEVFSSGVPQTISWETTEPLSCDDCLNPVLNPLNTSVYTLTVTSQDDCVTTIDLDVRVIKDRYVFIPNVFSPNSDNLNDQFTVFGNQAVANVDMLQIYSRWGELLFETKDLALNDELKGWDGFYKGRKMNPGVYIWQAKITFIDGESLMYSGDVTLVE